MPGACGLRNLPNDSRRSVRIFADQCCPAKAGMFNGRHQSHRGKSQESRSLDRIREETKWMKPMDNAILGMVSESPGRNVWSGAKAGGHGAVLSAPVQIPI
jgi:hypothetical protein